MPDPQTARRVLADRLLAIVEYKIGWRDDPVGMFDRVAEQFYRETGLMAPGKSLPLEITQDDGARKRGWDAFLRRLSDERDATIREAAAALAAVPVPAPGGLAALLAEWREELHRETNPQRYTLLDRVIHQVETLVTVPVPAQTPYLTGINAVGTKLDVDELDAALAEGQKGEK